MLSIQRSIPIPRIGLEKLINYIIFVGENPGVNCSVIKDKGLDVGKGRGDITRFFQRIGIIDVNNDCNVKLTDVGLVIFNALNTDLSLAKALMHLVLYSELPHYKVLIDVVSEENSIDADELREKINRRIKDLSPTAWINEVAYKALLGLAVDLDVIEIINGKVSIRFTASISECIKKSIVLMNNQKVFRLDDLSQCLSQLFKNFDIKTLLNNINGCVEPIVAPGPFGSKSTYFRVVNENCLVKQIINTIFKMPLRIN